MNRIFLILLLVSFFNIPLNSYAGEESVYSFSWLDPDKEVYVLQNRKFRKKGRFHVNAGFGMTTSGAFVDANNIQGRAGFFPYEEWGIEFVYSKNSGDENTTADSVRNNCGTCSGSVPFRRIVDDYMGGLLLWSPFYMKINTFNQILYVDWIIGLGYGKLQETNNRQEVLTSADFELETLTHSGIMWNTALKFYMSSTFSVRADLTSFHYEADVVDRSKKIWNQNLDLTLAVGLNF